MNAKERIMATLVGFVVFFLLGWVVYGMLMMDFYASNAGTALNVYRPDDKMIWWALILGNICQVYLLVYVFGKWAKISSFTAGLKAGAILGLIFGLAINLNMYATTNIMNLNSALIDAVVSMIMMGITGGVIGSMLKGK
jgi:magnesium-transporting ATPase (P-type)